MSPITEDLYASLGPWSRADTEDESWVLLDLAEAVGGRLQPIEDLIRDTDDGPGWSSILDLDRVPDAWLGWLAQFVGVRLRVGLGVIEQRMRITSTDGQHRGSPAALRAAARQYLVGPDGTGGSAYVIINERLGGNAYQLGILTLTSQTPDPAAVLAAILEQKPAGIVLTFNTVPGQTYIALETAYDTIGDVRADYATYSAVRSNLPT